jgi:hypothetical protein
VLDKVALDQIFLRVLGFFSVSLIPPVLCNHLCLHFVLTRGQTGFNWEKNKKSMADYEIWEHFVEE